MTNLPAHTTGPALTPLAEIERMGAAIAKSGLFGIKTPEQAVALMLIAQAENRHPASVARDYDIIQGRPAKKAEAMQRDFLQSGGTIEWHALDDSVADATFSHPQGGKVRITWDMKRAQTAGLGTKPVWKQYPRQMLRSRVISEGVRTVCPMATSGMYVPEEVQDFEPEKNRRKDRQSRDVSPAEAFTGAAPQESETGKPGALPPPAAEEKRDKDAWKDRRALELGFESRTAQSRAVYEFLDDVKGFGLTAEWAAKRMNEMDPPRKTLWALKPDELRLLHEALRKAGDAGERFKTPPPEFAPLPDDGVPF